MAITVHLEVEGNPLSMLLDFVEIAQSHTGIVLATEFVCILGEFGVKHKVGILYCREQVFTHPIQAPKHHLRQCVR